VMSRCLADAQRRLELAAGTLGGFHSGIALVTDVDGGVARFEVGARVRIEVADATAVATIDEVVQHDGVDAAAAAPAPPEDDDGPVRTGGGTPAAGVVTLVPPASQGTQLRFGEEDER
jgi:hypothetical protein